MREGSIFKGNIMKTLNTVTTRTTRATKAIARATKLKVVEYKNTKRSLVLPMEGLVLPCLSQEAKEMQDFVTGLVYSGARYERAYKKYAEEFNKSIVNVYEEYCIHKVPPTLTYELEEDQQWFIPEFQEVDLAKGYDILADLESPDANWYKILFLLKEGFTYEEIIDLDSYGFPTRLITDSRSEDTVNLSKTKLILGSKICSCIKYGGSHFPEIRAVLDSKSVEELEEILKVLDNDDTYPGIYLTTPGFKYLLNEAINFQGSKENLIIESLYEDGYINTEEYFIIKDLLSKGDRRKLMKFVIYSQNYPRTLYGLRDVYKSFGISETNIDLLRNFYFEIENVRLFESINIKTLNKYLKTFEYSSELNEYGDEILEISGVETTAEIILSLQIFGNEVLKGGVFKRPHDLFNLYGVDVIPLEEPLNQRWNQFFSKNLDCINHAYLTGLFTDFPKSKEFFLKTVEERSLGAEYGENVDAAKSLLDLGIPRLKINEAIKQGSRYTSKVKDLLPQVNIIDGKYTLERLAVGDIAHLWVGLPTDCCQHLNSVGKDCAINSYVSEKSSTYVLKRDGKILAQSWIWIDSESKAVVIDSIEYKRGLEISRVASMWLSLAKELSKKFDVFIGTTNYGCTKAVVDAWEDLAVIEAFTSDSYVHMSDYSGYMDGRTHFPTNLNNGEIVCTKI